MKTGKLFRFCCIAPLMMAKHTSQDLKFASNYGIFYGLIFQIIDDYLDVVSSFNQIGKTPGKDKKQGKSTIIQYMNINEVVPYCEQMIKKFIQKNNKYFFRWPILDNLLLNIININKFIV